MATAAIVTARQNAGRKRKGADLKNRVSFHLQLHLGDEVRLPEGETSVGLLRSQLRSREPGQQESEEPSKSKKEKKSLKHEIGTRFEVWIKKFNTKSQTIGFSSWQERLLIVTDRRLFVISRTEAKLESMTQSASPEKSTATVHASKDLEIVDSIPVEEIISVEFNNGQNGWEPVFELKPPTLKKKLQEIILKVAEFLNIDIKLKAKNEEKREETRQLIESVQGLLTQEYLRQLFIEEDSYWGGLVRIVTDPEGFNRGHPFYFLLKKETYSSLKGALHWKQATKGISRTLSNLNWQNKAPQTNAVSKKSEDQKVVRKLQKLAHKRRLEVKRETRFLRLQTYLQSIWNSKRFNFIVLFLIVSNFVFTVQQLENTDPARQPYFEKIDLAYTIIFSCGDSLL
jgi:hypothetical protein